MPRVPHDVHAILKGLAAFLDSRDEDGREPCNARCGVYVFYTAPEIRPYARPSSTEISFETPGSSIVTP